MLLLVGALSLGLACTKLDSGSPLVGLNIPKKTAVNADKYLKDRFPSGYRILETDREALYTEIDVLYDGLKYEVKFNAANNWLSTKVETRAKELPAAVTDALAAAGYLLDDETIDFYETPQGNFYEIDTKKDGREYNLQVDKDGKILQSRIDR